LGVYNTHHHVFANFLIHIQCTPINASILSYIGLFTTVEQHVIHSGQRYAMNCM